MLDDIMGKRPVLRCKLKRPEERILLWDGSARDAPFTHNGENLPHEVLDQDDSTASHGLVSPVTRKDEEGDLLRRPWQLDSREEPRNT